MDWDTPPVRRNKIKEDNTPNKVESLDSSKLFKQNFASKGIVIIMVLSVLVLISAFVIRPALIGYSIAKQADETNLSVSELGATVQDLRLELASTKANLSLYSEVYNKVWAEVKTTTGDLTGCLSEKEGLAVEIEDTKHRSEIELAECEQKQTESTTQINQQLVDKDKKITETEQKLSDLQENFDEFAFNIARSVCCKAKVDNPNINSYEISNNRLICLENGELGLNC